MFSFGSGVLYGFRTDAGVDTPVNFGLVQEVSLDLAFDTKELYGQYQFPVAVARGKAKFSGKAKLARLSGIAVGSLFFGISPIAGQILTALGEEQTVPGVTFQVTVDHQPQFLIDYGVVYAATGLPLTKVAAGPAVGQYTCDGAGVYNFAPEDEGEVLLFTYTYSTTAGEKIVSINKLLGDTPTFSANFYTTFQSKPITVKIPNCVSSKLTFPTKLDDFVMPDFEWSMFADAAGNVATWSFGEAS